MTTNIGIALFNNTTAEEFMFSTKEWLGHKNKVHAFTENDIILLLNLELQIVFGICVLGIYEDGNTYRYHHPLDIDIYSGEASKYNRYDIKINKFVKVHIPFNKLARLCGKSVDDSTKTNIWKGTHLNFSRVFYKSEDETEVISRLKDIIEILLST